MSLDVAVGGLYGGCTNKAFQHHLQKKLVSINPSNGYTIIAKILWTLSCKLKYITVHLRANRAIPSGSYFADLTFRQNVFFKTGLATNLE